MTVNTARAEDDPDTITVSGGESTDSFVARDEATGVVSQGKTKVEALVNLADALKLYHQSNSEESEPNPSTAPWF